MEIPREPVFEPHQLYVVSESEIISCDPDRKNVLTRPEMWLAENQFQRPSGSWVNESAMVELVRRLPVGITEKEVEDLRYGKTYRMHTADTEALDGFPNLKSPAQLTTEGVVKEVKQPSRVMLNLSRPLERPNAMRLVKTRSVPAPVIPSTSRVEVLAVGAKEEPTPAKKDRTEQRKVGRAFRRWIKRGNKEEDFVYKEAEKDTGGKKAATLPPATTGVTVSKGTAES
jgi:hypothetical protein